MAEWEVRRIRDLVQQRKDTVILRPGVEYRTMGVRWHGKGAYERGVVTTTTIKAVRLWRAHAGDFVFNRIDTQNGAFDVIPKELHGALLTNEFPTYSGLPEVLDVRFLLVYFQQQSVLDTIALVRAGSEGRARWKESDFEAWTLAVPSLPEQRRIVGVVAAVDAQMKALEEEVVALDKVYANALGRLWLTSTGEEAPMRRLGESLDLDIRRVKLEPEVEYRIAGVLNAGQGLITREPIMGRETDYATMNRLSAGQAVMRKLTAWEGTVGVVSPEYDGYFASNEFPTFSFRSCMQAGYFAHVCRSARLWDEMKNRVTGTVERRKRLNPDQLLGVSLPLPDVAQQEQVSQALDAVLALRSAAETQLGALRTVRADLVSALLSREITVDALVDKYVKAA